MEFIGTTVEKRNLVKNIKTTAEILRTIDCDLFWGVFANYVFGSQYEDTTLTEMGSDEDVVLVFNRLEVVTNIENDPEHSLLLIEDDQTPAGYVKLQLMMNGIPLSMFDMRVHDHEVHKTECPVDADRSGRVLCCHPERRHGYTFPVEIHGPAIQIDGIPGKVLSNDCVIAFRGRSFPKSAEKWLTRERLYNWPPTEIIEKCKTLGFLVVPVAHPHSKDNYTLWRLSLSHQERLLVTYFSSVQLKCFVLLKVLKKETINKTFKDKILTSYHCKTCMLYMIETTPGDFWVPEKLAICLSACLKMIYRWAQLKYCPNYFIPEENMFDKLSEKDLENLSAALQSVLTHDLANVMLQIRTNQIGELLKDKQYTYTLNGRIYTINRNGSDLVIFPFVKTRHRLRCLLDHITELLDIRTSLLVQNYNINLEVVVQNLRSSVTRLESVTRVTEHTEEETKTAISLLKPFILPTLMSNEIALSIQQQQNRDEIRKNLLVEKWQASSDQIDSFQMKISSILYAVGYFWESLNALKSIPGGLKFSFCSCYRTGLTYENPLIVVAMLPRLNNDVTTKDLLREVVSPCVAFLPTEAAVTPRVIMHDCLRALCVPRKPEKLHVHQNHQLIYQHEIAYIDGLFLYPFLLYLNHKQLKQQDLLMLDILLMKTFVSSRKISHKSTCLNILGWVYKQEGFSAAAVECFQDSIRTEAKRNAAYWHLSFLICENY